MTAPRFEHCSMVNVVFHDCAHTCAAFDDADLSGATFHNVNLSGARFARHLSGLDIHDVFIDGLTIVGIDVDALIRAEVVRTGRA